MQQKRPSQSSTSEKTQSLPDIARDSTAQTAAMLDRVGMSGIETVLRRRSPEGELFLMPAKADAFVNLDDPEARGIHMSRLYLDLQRLLEENEFTFPLLQKALEAFTRSHSSLSTHSYLRLSYDIMRRRDSLVSENTGWRHYPVSLEASWNGKRTDLKISFRVTYSSSCPCSAALSRQTLKERFEEDFSDHQAISLSHVANWLQTREATSSVPHSQRSHADLTVVVEKAEESLIEELIDQVEETLGTAVQAAVKREDEQEFAALNGANLMFCEDAARRICSLLDEGKGFRDYRIEVRHMESLHPHDAVAITTKGVEGGLRP